METSMGQAPKPTRTRHTVSPEIASGIREEIEALSSTIETATAVAQAAASAANATIAAARARHAAATRPVLRMLQLDDATIVAVEGFGDATVLVIDLPPVESPEAPA
jgi:hypothetical protein